MAQKEKQWSPYASIYNPIKVGSIDGTDSEPHDNGIVRAINAVYNPSPLSGRNPKATLFIGRLDTDVNEKDLEKIFSKHGALHKVTVVRDTVTGFSKKYGFVEFKDSHDCRRARREEHKAILKGREILVDFEFQHTLPGWIPRRLGGGFGGRKESGQLRFGCLDRPWKKPLHLQYPQKNTRLQTTDNSTGISSKEEYRRRDRRDKSESPSRRHYNFDDQERKRSHRDRSSEKKHSDKERKSDGKRRKT